MDPILQEFEGEEVNILPIFKNLFFQKTFFFLTWMEKVLT